MAAGATITIKCHTNHISGPFVPGYELAEEIVNMLEGETLQPGESEYEIMGVEEVDVPKTPTRKPEKGGASGKFEQPGPLEALCPKCQYDGPMPTIMTTAHIFRAICPSCVTAYKISRDGKDILAKGGEE